MEYFLYQNHFHQQLAFHHLTIQVNGTPHCFVQILLGENLNLCEPSILEYSRQKYAKPDDITLNLQPTLSISLYQWQHSKGCFSERKKRELKPNDSRFDQLPELRSSSETLSNQPGLGHNSSGNQVHFIQSKATQF